MKIEKWKYNGEDVDIEILDDSEIESNKEFEDLEKTLDLSNELKDLENKKDE